MSSPMHGYDLRSNVESGLNRRIKAMVAANGGPERCIGKPSATGLGVHIIFLSEQSPIPTTSQRPSTRTPREEEDIEMVDSSESSSDSDIDTAEQHTPRREHKRPSSTLDAPRVPRRTEDRRPRTGTEGTRIHRRESSGQHGAYRKASASSPLRSEGCRGSSVESEGAAPRRGQEDPNRAADEAGSAGGAAIAPTRGRPRASILDRRWHQPRWSSLSPSPPPATLPAPHPHDERSPTPTPTLPPSPGLPQVAGPSIQLARGPLRQQSTMPLAHLPRTTTPPRADEFVVVARQVVDGLDDLTGSHVRHKKWYRVRAADLESLNGSSDMEEEL
ncbi:hypothetical protein BJV78DRAFT_1227709 [Lactifluus subvellereus]|nr:hypothetical protein BJV78DRAFT_1227709 [Lactifluus subvellereus]